MVGKLEPGKSVAKGNTLLQMLTAVAGMFAGTSAQAAAGKAEDAAQSAEQVAQVAAGGRMSFAFETDDGEQPPTPPRPRSSNAAIVLAVLAVAYTLYMAQDLLLPVLLAAFFALVGNPIIRLLRKLWIPRFVAAVLVLGLGMFGAYSLARELVTPGAEWIREVPKEMRSLAPKLRSLTKPVTEANRAAENIARAAGGETGTKVQVVKTEVNDPYSVLTSTPRRVASFLAVVLLTFFFMVYGGDLQRNAIALLPSRQQKKLTVEILHAIETEISRYVLTISIINVIVGLVFAGLLYFAARRAGRRGAAVGHDGGPAEFRALRRPADRHLRDAGDGLRQLWRNAPVAGAGGAVPGPAYAGRADRHADRARAAAWRCRRWC